MGCWPCLLATAVEKLIEARKRPVGVEVRPLLQDEVRAQSCSRAHYQRLVKQETKDVGVPWSRLQQREAERPLGEVLQLWRVVVAAEMATRPAGDGHWPIALPRPPLGPAMQPRREAPLGHASPRSWC